MCTASEGASASCSADPMKYTPCVGSTASAGTDGEVPSETRPEKQQSRTRTTDEARLTSRACRNAVNDSA